MNDQVPERNKNIIMVLVLMIAVWLSLLFIESSGPASELLSALPELDKVAHFFAFGILGLLLCALSFNLDHKVKIPIFSMPLLIVCSSGGLEEIYQMTVPGRTASIADFSADVLGAVFAIILANRLSLISRATTHNTSV